MKSREEGKGRKGDKKGGEMERKIREIEKDEREGGEKKERSGKRSKGGEGEGVRDVEKKVKELIQKLGIEVEMEKVRCVGNRREKGRRR